MVDDRMFSQRKPLAQFSLSTTSSAASSRASSPAPFRQGEDSQRYDDLDTNHFLDSLSKDLDMSKGSFPRDSRPTDVYEATLPWWRAAVRRKLVRTVQIESKVIARMQDMIRTPWLDAYFVYTSSLGTHTFFMIMLPALYFFGHSDIAQGLLLVLAVGVYCSSVVKDLFCSPRPFAPPVTRLTMGTHHLEYGFPSTHTTNSVSIALFLFGHLHRLASLPSTPNTSFSHLNSNLNGTSVGAPAEALSNLSTPVVSSSTFTLFTIILIIYTISIVFGRLYTAMHSFTDCITGVILGSSIWWAIGSWTGIPFVFSSYHPLYYVASLLGIGTPIGASGRLIYIGRGLGTEKWINSWIMRGGWEVPLILIPICLLLVNQHPQPVDDCPCFEDAIAFGAVGLGVLVGKWGMNFAGVGKGVGRTVVMPGSGWIFELGQWVEVERGWTDVGIWWAMAAVKMTVGIVTIFAWRIIAKSALHLILPPIFRLLARGFRLPNRRFYVPATEYKNVPSEFNTSAGFGLHPIPSVIDLPGTNGVGVEVGGIGSGVNDAYRMNGREIKIRSVAGTGNGYDTVNGKDRSKLESENGNGDLHGMEHEFVVNDEESEQKGDSEIKHYDADVLTKVIVYAGIAVLAAEVLPLFFEIVGWGVKSWV